MKKALPLSAIVLLSACAGAELARQKKMNEELREKAGAMLVQIKDKSDAAEAASAAKADAEAKLAIAGARIESLEKSNKDLSESIGASRSDLGGKLNAVVAEKDELAKKLAELQKEKISLERTKNLYRSARDKAQAELAKLQQEKQALEEEAAARKKADDERAARRHDDLGKVADAILKEMQAGKIASAESADRFSLALSDSLLFDDDSAKISGDGAALLERLGRPLKALGGRDIRVESYTDNGPIKKGLLGGYEDHWSLSAARAAAVTRWLHEHAGLDPARMTAVGYGEFSPVQPNDSDEGRAANRRLVVSVATP